jgi:glycosyltransferase involved in cell wall biosynthesis
MKLLLIGPASLGIAGGISVSFHHLRNSLLQRSDPEIEVVDTVGIRQRKLMAPFALSLFFWRVLRAAHRSDIVTLHAMPTALPYIGWFIWAVAALWGLPLIYRAFGGGYHDELTGRCRRRLAAWFMRRASVVLLQTKQLMDRAATDTLRQTVWFPTARPMPTRVAPRTGPCRRFVYVGQLKIGKGLEYLARAAAHLPQDANVDVYGPWYNLPRDTFAGRRGIRYVGELHPGEVVPTLNRYDACVIPTFLPMEGHPGIVLETCAAGIPIIATRWKAVPEIVKDGVSGILIEPRSEGQIADAMTRLYEDDSLYCRLAVGSAAMRHEFSQERQTDRFIEVCRDALVRRRG